MVNSLVAPSAGVLAWMGIERLVSGKPSMLGGASARSPAGRGDAGRGDQRADCAMLLGALASLACYGAQLAADA
jgi:Amt family ammonium transporter